MGNFLVNSVKILKLFVGVGRWYTSKCVKKKINKLNCWFLINFLGWPNGLIHIRSSYIAVWLGLFHLNIPGRGECHLFQTSTNRRRKKDSTHHHQNLLLKVPHYHLKKNNKNIFLYRNTQSFTLMIYQYTACKSFP
jgi:hypothetical protein